MSKLLVFLAVIGFLAGGMMVVNFAYRPRGAMVLKGELEDVRGQLQNIDAETARSQDLARESRARLNERLADLTAKLKEKGVKVDNGDEVLLNVVVQRVEPMPIRDEMTLPACVEARENILLPTKNDGTLEWVGAKEGETVKKGQLLAKIDTARVEQELRRAEAAEKLARANQGRTANLVRERVASQVELDRTTSEWDQAKAALAIARQAVADSNLVSPIDGVLDDWIPDQGEYVNRGAGVARVVDASTVKLCVNVPEKDVAFLRIGQIAKVAYPEAVGGKTTGTITRIQLVAEEQSRTFRVEIVADNHAQAFRPGMITRADLLRRSHDKAIVIPFFTVLQTQDGPVVYVENKGKAEPRKVSIGIRQGTMLEVTSGLRAGDRLIVKGQRSLSEGTPVRVVETKL